MAEKRACAANREGRNRPERFTDPGVRKNVALDLTLADTYDQQIGAVELYLTRTAKVDDPQA